MIVEIDCPNCGVNRIRDNVTMCGECATAAWYESRLAQRHEPEPSGRPKPDYRWMESPDMCGEMGRSMAMLFVAAISQRTGSIALAISRDGEPTGYVLATADPACARLLEAAVDLQALAEGGEPRRELPPALLAAFERVWRDATGCGAVADGGDDARTEDKEGGCT